MLSQSVLKTVFSPRIPPRKKCSTSRRNSRLLPLGAVKEVFMPALSSTMTEGKIVSWLKSEGDKVTKGEAIVVVESDKADMDVESFNEGYLGKIVVEEGGVATVGAPIAFIADTEGEIQDAVGKSNEVVTTNTPAPVPATETPTKTEEVVVSQSVQTTPPPPPPPPPPPVAVPVKRTDGRVIATPFARKLAKKLKVDLKNVAGTGPAGRITAEDVKNASSGKAPVVAPVTPTNGAPVAVDSVSSPAPKSEVVVGTPVSELLGTTVPFNALEAAVAKGMVSSLQVPEFRVACSIETDEFDSLYKKLKPKGVTMTALLAKACGVALAKHPILYASCTPCGTGVTYNEHVNVAIAVTMQEGGLITPVLADADSKDIYSLSRDWADLVKRARVKKLTPVEYTSGTFTMSNLGMYGVDSFDAILPVGTAGILAIGSSMPKVVANKEGLIGVKKVMQVNLTCDHRIVYGAQAAEFLQTLRNVIQDPEQLTM
eukprot:g7742.t1